MKILHTSDWHLGRSLMEKSLLEDQKHVLAQILEFLRKNPHDVFIIAGDLYDRSIPGEKAVQLFGWFLTELRKFTALPILIIPGNHDNALRLSYGSDFFKISGIYFCTDPEAMDKAIRLGDEKNPVDFYLMPFLDPSSFSDHGKDQIPARNSHESSLREAMERINRVKSETAVNILVAHLFTAGATTSDSERTLVGTAGCVDASLLQGFDYVALGHLHKSQNIGERIHYSGSPLKYSFSEHLHEKMLLSVTVTKTILHIGRIPLLPCVDMARLEGRFRDLLESSAYSEYENRYLEVQLTDDTLVSNPLALLKSRFPQLLAVRQSPGGDWLDEKSLRLTQSLGPEEDFQSFYRHVRLEEPPTTARELFRQSLKDCVDDGLADPTNPKDLPP